MLVRGIGVMRRRSDSWINATQLLKVAGISKSQRTKILDKDIAAPDSGIQFEKVQGGYGRYQGTWIPFHEAETMAEQYGILDLIRPLLEYQPAPPQAPLAGLPQQSPSALPSGPLEPLKPQQSQKAPTQANARINGPPQDQATGRKRPRPSLTDTQTNGQSYVSEVSTVALSDAGSNKRLRVDGNGSATAGSSAKPTQLAIPQALRRATKHPEGLQISQDHRSALMSLFMTDSETEPSNLSEPDAQAVISSFPADLNPDLPIDEQQHTALHWASALARLSTVQALMNLGADPNRGNSSGETPLMRAVLVTNNYDSETFSQVPTGLLSLLASSIRTLDEVGRTVLHHVALVAGIKGRSAAARHYMETILHFLAENDAEAKERGDSLINVQDSNGDSALNIAARVGSKAMVRMLLESGADSHLPNKLGLRAGDFGFLEEGLQSTTPAESALELVQGSQGQKNSLPTESDVPRIPPEQQVGDVTTAISTLLAALAADFAAEVQARTDSLQRTRAQLHQATKEVADQRANLAALRSRVRQVELSKWRIRNLEKALAEEETFDWTGRLGIDGEPAFADGVEDADIDPSLGENDRAKIRAAFEYRGPESVLKQLPAVDMPANIDSDAPLPAAAVPFAPQGGNNASPAKAGSSPQPSQLTLLQLRRMVLWYERAITLLQDCVQASKDSDGEVEVEARRLIKICTGVTQDEEVEEMLDNLITALESDGAEGSGPDLQR